MTDQLRQQEEFSRRVLSFLSADALDLATDALRTYLVDDFTGFTGRWFETTVDRDPNRMTANDLVAVTMLSVDVPPRAAHWILNEGATEISSLLEAVGPVTREIWDPESDLTRDSEAWELSSLIRGLPDVGRTTTSKLLAAKRPHLFPIYDKIVGAALGIGNANYWALWQELLRGEIGHQARQAVQQLKVAVPESEHLSTLRVLDIVVWMQSRDSQSDQE